MSTQNRIQLKTSSITNVPFQTYSTDFTFIVNGEEIKTNRLISELLSPKICQLHSYDPTADRFYINTKSRGDFSKLIKLINFETSSISDDELPFFIEVLDILKNDNINIELNNNNKELSNDNVITILQQHEEHRHFYKANIDHEIEFISNHISDLIREQREKFISLGVDTLKDIISHRSLRLENEDELLEFVNFLYQNDNRFCELYESVLFENATSITVSEFTSKFDMNDMTSCIWRRLTRRLDQEIKKESNEHSKENDKRYKNRKENGNERQNKQERFLEFKYEEGKEFNGIIRHLLNETNNNIEKELDITSSSVNGDSRKPKFSISFDDQSKFFQSQSENNGWLRFDFKNHRVIPTHYTIRSYNYSPHYLMTWNLEGSNDNTTWTLIDSQTNCQHLIGKLKTHTFSINEDKQKEYQYIRIRITGSSQTGHNYYYLTLNSFEIYGSFLK